MFIRSKCVLGVTAKDGTCPIYPGCTAEVDDQEGKRAVESGYAVEIAVGVTGGTVRTASNASKCETPSSGKDAWNGLENAGKGEQVSGHLVREDLEAMSFTQLKELAKDMGIETGRIKSKACMIEAICAVEVLADADNLEEAPPVFDAQEVIDE